MQLRTYLSSYHQLISTSYYCILAVLKGMNNNILANNLMQLLFSYMVCCCMQMYVLSESVYVIICASCAIILLQLHMYIETVFIIIFFDYNCIRICGISPEMSARQQHACMFGVAFLILTVSMQEIFIKTIFWSEATNPQ